MADQGPEIGRACWQTESARTTCGRAAASLSSWSGSGPGVSAHANWRLTIPTLAQRFRVYAPGMVGVRVHRVARPDQLHNLKTWTDRVIGFLDALGIERASLGGKSCFGGAIALHAATRHPQRVNRLVLMGSVGVPFPITAGFDAVWGTEPSLESMSAIMDYFAYNKDLLTGELAQVRFKASTAPGFQASYSAMFPAPRQRWVDGMVTPDESIAALRHPTLVIHGREDRVVPLANSTGCLDLIPESQLHVFGHCGHWTRSRSPPRSTTWCCVFSADR